jgi:hypothetical protein
VRGSKAVLTATTTLCIGDLNARGAPDLVRPLQNRLRNMPPASGERNRWFWTHLEPWESALLGGHVASGLRTLPARGHHPETRYTGRYPESSLSEWIPGHRKPVPGAPFRRLPAISKKRPFTGGSEVIGDRADRGVVKGVFKVFRLTPIRLPLLHLGMNGPDTQRAAAEQRVQALVATILEIGVAGSLPY